MTLEQPYLFLQDAPKYVEMCFTWNLTSKHTNMFLSFENKRDGKSATCHSTGGRQSMKFAFVLAKTPSATCCFPKMTIDNTSSSNAVQTLSHCIVESVTLFIKVEAGRHRSALFQSHLLNIKFSPHTKPHAKTIKTQ